MKDYHSQYNTLKRRVKRLKRNVRSLKNKLEDLNKYMDRKTMINLIYKIAFLPNIKKYKGFSYSFKISDESNSVEIIEVREKKAILYKQ